MSENIFHYKQLEIKGSPTSEIVEICENAGNMAVKFHNYSGLLPKLIITTGQIQNNNEVVPAILDVDKNEIVISEADLSKLQGKGGKLPPKILAALATAELFSLFIRIQQEEITINKDGLNKKYTGDDVSKQQAIKIVKSLGILN